jgi:hypothetical protein
MKSVTGIPATVKRGAPQSPEGPQSFSPLKLEEPLLKPLGSTGEISEGSQPQ